MNTVGILGGMGPAAGADFVRLFVQACGEQLAARSLPVTDQAYPAHWLVQIPAPGRTEALLDNGRSPLPAMAAAMLQLRDVGARAVAIACNTAHLWHRQLREACPEVTLLHMVEETARDLSSRGIRRVGLLATLGTHRLKLYEPILAAAGIRSFTPEDDEQVDVMRGIREGVKAGRIDVARDCFEEVARALAARHGLDTLVLACTEIPLALRALPGVRLVDPAQVLARALARHAYAGEAQPAAPRAEHCAK